MVYIYGKIFLQVGLEVLKDLTIRSVWTDAEKVWNHSRL